MDSHPDTGDGNQCSEAKETYALVAYIPEPIAAFLNELRARLDPGSDPHAHVTILPPRQLSGPPEEARHHLRLLTAGLKAFTLHFSGIEVFHCTNVVFLALGEGKQSLHQIHDTLNSGVLAYPEPFDYHPHVTLVQFQPPEVTAAKTKETRASWQAWAGPRQFRVNRLTFVKHLGGNHWLDLEGYDLE